MDATKIQKMVYYTAGAVLFGLFFLILVPFLLPLFWAVVFAIILEPANRLFVKKTKNRSVASLLTLLLGVLPVVALLVLALGAAVTSADTFYQSVRSALLKGDFYVDNTDTGLASMEFFGKRVEAFPPAITAKLHASLAELGDYLARGLSSVGANMLLFTVKLFVMLYALFFFLRDGEAIIARGRRLVPAGGKLDAIIFQRFAKVATAVLKMTVIMGSLQGLIGGALFYFAGFSSALVLGLLMAVATLVPSVGCAIVWLPLGGMMLANGDVQSAMIIIGGGIILLTPIDYFLRPALIGRDLGVHPLLVFLSSLGGIMLIGFSGLLIGPIVAALALAVLGALIDNKGA